MSIRGLFSLSQPVSLDWVNRGKASTKHMRQKSRQGLPSGRISPGFFQSQTQS